MFFFEKKNQKTFDFLGAYIKRTKVFCFFFSKKKFFLPFFVATPAFAHAFLQGAVPPVGATVSAPPTEVSLTYTEDVEPDFSKIAVQDSSGADVTAGPVHAAGSATIAVALKKLSAGTYKVVWHVTSVDTHKTQGNFVFTVLP